jgi:hypothetical protein
MANRSSLYVLTIPLWVPAAYANTDPTNKLAYLHTKYLPLAHLDFLMVIGSITIGLSPLIDSFTFKLSKVWACFPLKFNSRNLPLDKLLVFALFLVSLRTLFKLRFYRPGLYSPLEAVLVLPYKRWSLSATLWLRKVIGLDCLGVMLLVARLNYFAFEIWGFTLLERKVLVFLMLIGLL